MNLLNLMKPDYVKERYDLASLQVIESNGMYLSVALKDTGSEYVLYVAAAEKDAGSVVNLAALINADDLVDISEHIFGYYEDMPKYANVPDAELWKFSDELAQRFAAGSPLEEVHINPFIDSVVKPFIEETVKDGDLVLEFSSSFKHLAMKALGLSHVRIPYKGRAVKNWCAICEIDIQPNLDFCDSCKELMAKHN